MPPRRGTKRTATPVQEEEVHEPKQMKKKGKFYLLIYFYIFFLLFIFTWNYFNSRSAVALQLG